MEVIEDRTSAPELPLPKGFWARFAGVFISPGETFADVVRRPDVIDPLMVLTLVSVAVTEIALGKTDMGQGLRHIVRLLEVLLPSLRSLISAAFGLLFVNAFFGGKMNFKTSFSVACYAELIGLPGDAIRAVVQLFGHTRHSSLRDLQSLTPANLGFFLNRLTTSKEIMALAGSMDIFLFWIMAAEAIGYAAASKGKAHPLSIFMCFFGLWAVGVLAQMWNAPLR